MKRFNLLVLVSLLFSCVAKKESIERTIISDTLINRSHELKSEAIQTNYIFDLVCDSTGIIRDFKMAETSGKNSAKVNLQNNKLDISLLTGISQFKTDTIIQIQFKDKLMEKEKTILKTPHWHWFAHILSILVIIILVRLVFK